MKCILCGSENSKLFLKNYDIKTSKKHFDILQCMKCGFRYTYPYPSYDEIYKYYGNNYYSYADVKKVVKSVSSNGKRYLDIGCGSGKHIIDKMNEGYDAYGVEIDINVVNKCVESGLKVKQSVRGKLDFGDNYFDIIQLNHVLEHLHDINNVMEEIYRCLKVKGVLKISVPNIDSYDFSLYRQYWRHLDTPRHLYHFNKADLNQLLINHNFRNIQINTSHVEISKSYIKGLYTVYKSMINDRKNPLYSLIKITGNLCKYLVHGTRNDDGINLNAIAEKKTCATIDEILSN